MRLSNANATVLIALARPADAARFLQSFVTTAPRNGHLGLTARSIAKALVAAALLGAAPVAAHHGAGLFDGEKTVTVAGAVTEFQFVNPHVLIYLDVPSENGQVRWGGELTSPNRLARMGGAVSWHKDILKPGDQITMTGNPARNGAPAMDITKLVNADGIVLIGD